MKRITLAVSAAALLAGTTFASAQVYFDDPPGYAWQRRGVVEDSGRPYGYRYRGAYGAYGYDGYAVVPAPRYYRRDDPPGSRFQDTGNDEDMGRNPLRWR